MCEKEENLNGFNSAIVNRRIFRNKGANREPRDKREGDL
jgi:hypothetical protein